MIAPWVIARRCGGFLALACAASLCAAQDPDPLWRSWLECRAFVERLGAERGALQARADSLAAARARVRAAGAGDREKALLVRGDALSDSLRALSAAALAQELVCEQARHALLDALDARLAAREDPAAPAGPGRDSLLARQERALAAPRAPLLAEFDVPPPDDDASPDVLRQAAAYARDLGDRIARWQDVVRTEEERLARRRLSREASRLQTDQAFFEDPATVHAGPPGTDGAEGLEGGVFAQLIARVPGGAPEAAGAEAVMAILKRWLETKREDLMREADALDREAARREGEP